MVSDNKPLIPTSTSPFALTDASPPTAIRLSPCRKVARTTTARVASRTAGGFVMRKRLLGVVGVVLFGSFGMLSGAFAAPQEEAEPAAIERYGCTVNWKSGSDQCKSQGTSGRCTTKYQGDHASASEAKERCESAMGVHLGVSGVESCGPCSSLKGTAEDPVERCKKACDAINLICIARCPRRDKNCMNRCNQELGRCLKDCER